MPDLDFSNDHGSSAASISQEGKRQPHGLIQPSPEPVPDRLGM